MNALRSQKIVVEQVVLVLLVLGLGISVYLALFQGGPEPIPTRAKKEPGEAVFQPLKTVVVVVNKEAGLFVSDLRVAAIGSAYPILYGAETCPFSGVPQPKMNQLDRDGDGITDDWELKFGLDKYNRADAQDDPDDDGFTNLEEFSASKNPRSAESHPPYAEKLRFIQRKDVPFPLVFQGYTELSDGRTVFQINNPTTGKTHFGSVGETVEDVYIQRFEMNEGGRDHRLYVQRGGFDVELIRGESALDPESKAELINILDRSPVMVTMGALLSLHSNEYAVLGVYADKVVLRDTDSGVVYEVVGFAEGEQ